MIIIKNKDTIRKMEEAGQLLLQLFEIIDQQLIPGVNTLEIDTWIGQELQKRKLVSQAKGYKGYKHFSCISVNDVVVHGVPAVGTVLKSGDLVKVDVCAALNGYCADMARSFFIGTAALPQAHKLVAVAQQSLDKGIEQARAGNRLSDISAAIQAEVEHHGFGVVRDFAGHGIGKKMHEEPEILNYGKAGSGPVLRVGMTFAIEPMITAGNYEVFVEDDGWTVKTTDKSLAAHVEDTIVITENEPKILTRKYKRAGV
jgi:methionyl aminopeptidase